jgi:hypothetical protein
MRQVPGIDVAVLRSPFEARRVALAARQVVLDGRGNVREHAAGALDGMAVHLARHVVATQRAEGAVRSLLDRAGLDEFFHQRSRRDVASVALEQHREIRRRQYAWAAIRLEEIGIEVPSGEHAGRVVEGILGVGRGAGARHRPDATHLAARKARQQRDPGYVGLPAAQAELFGRRIDEHLSRQFGEFLPRHPRTQQPARHRSQPEAARADDRAGRRTCHI